MAKYPYTAIRGPGQPGYATHSRGLAQAVDFRTPEKVPVYLPAGSSWRCSVSRDLRESYGRWIEVEGPVTLRFAHLSRRDLVAGRTYPGGTLLGLTGNTGNSSGPHLHFEADADIWDWAELIWEANVLTKDDKDWIIAQIRKQAADIVDALTVGRVKGSGFPDKRVEQTREWAKQNNLKVIRTHRASDSWP